DNVGHTFSLSRTFVFFPYFLIGFWVTKNQILVLKQKAVKYSALLFLAVAALVIYFLPDIDSGWLLSSKSYSTLGTVERSEARRVGDQRCRFGWEHRAN